MTPTTPGLDVRALPIERLTPAPYNPRKRLRPGDPAWNKLEASLREFGLVEPLVWNELSGHVVGGHARLAILRLLGVTEVPVSVVRLSPEREKALNVVLNNREAQGRFDAGKLAELLADLEPLPELELTGFTVEDLAAMRMRPADAAVADAETGRVEVVLECDAAGYERLAADLDRLVATYDLVCHVRRR
jgi:ParB-like chromosome segregation protein Spo0J